MTILANYKTFNELAYVISTQPSVFDGTAYFIDKFGYNLDIDSGTSPEDIWSVGGTKTVNTIAAPAEIVSSSANDAAGGTGAQLVRCYVYDGLYNTTFFDIAPTGTSAAPVPFNLLDCYRMELIQAGSLLTNAGTITLRLVSGPVTLAEIPAGVGQTQMTHYIIPAGFTGFISAYTIGVGGIQGISGGKIGSISYYEMPLGYGWEKKETYGVTSDSGPFKEKHDHPEIIPEKTRIKFVGTAEKDNMEAYVSYEIFLISNSLIV